MGFFFPRSDLVTKPAPRTGVMAYGPAQGAFVLFGGQGAGDQLQDTWAFDGSLWRQKSPLHSPVKRRGHAMATGLAVEGVPDPGVTMVGGYYFDGSNHYLIDVCQYTGETWKPITMDGVSPDPREFHAMAYNPKAGIFCVCGGRNNEGSLSDTQLIGPSDNFERLMWIPADITGGPSARYGHSIVWDEVNENFVMFGGESSPGSFFGDTYVLDGYTWIQKFPVTNPQPRSFHRMVWDPVIQRVVLYGGKGVSGNLSDVFTWTGFNWVSVSITGTGPSSRFDFAMATNTETNMIFLFGGDGSLLNDTWGFVPGAVDANGLNIPLPSYMMDVVNSFEIKVGYSVPPDRS